MDLTLKPIQEESPSGENLEYDKLFQDLELISRPAQDQQMGDEVVTGDAPVDSDVAEKAHEVLAASHELRAAVILANAEVRMNGFAGFAPVTTYIRGCLEEYWDTCHPQLDAEDDNDPTMRVNSVLGLGDRNTIVKALRNAPLTLSKAFGRVTLRDIEIAEGEITATDDDKNLDSAAISAAFQDTDDAALAEIAAAVEKAAEDVKAIDVVFNDKIPGEGPNLAELMKLLQRVGKRMRVETGGDDLPEEIREEGGAAAPQVADKASSGSGAINSPADVERAIDKIITYYAANEPSSPVPLVLQRAKRLVGANFMDIMKDIAPDGISNVQSVSGITDAE